MVVQLLSSFAYSLVESSWMVSTILVKYFLLTGVVYSLYKDNGFLEGFRSFIEFYSDEMITLIILTGLVTMVLGASFSPLVAIFSHLTAVTYFGYLFWKF